MFSEYTGMRSGKLMELELNLARDSKDNNMGSLQYISSSRQVWENVGSQLMVTKDQEEAELWKVSYCFSLYCSHSPLESLTL